MKRKIWINSIIAGLFIIAAGITSIFSVYFGQKIGPAENKFGPILLTVVFVLLMIASFTGFFIFGVRIMNLVFPYKRVGKK